MKSFVALSLIAGALNYAYQLLASHYLSLGNFAEFGAWFARISMFLTPAIALQYYANFHPQHGRTQRLTLILLNICLLSGTLAWSLFNPPLGATRGAFIVLGAAIVGWLSGQAQIGLHLRALAIAGVVLAVAKVASVILIDRSSAAAFAAPLMYSYLPAAWILTAVLWRTHSLPPKSSSGSRRQVLAVLILSLASACLPQIDIALLHHTQSETDFALFALASLFYKAIYFVALAFLQWLFPHQVRGVAREFSPRQLARMGYLAVMGSGLVAFVGPALGQFLLGWSATPPESWVFLGCVNIALLTWIYVGLQSACAAGNIRPAFSILMFLALETLAQFYLRLGVLPYLSCATLCQTALATLQILRIGTFGPESTDPTKGAFAGPDLSN